MSNPTQVVKDVGPTKDVRYGRTTVTANTATAISTKVTGLKHGVLIRCPGTADPGPNTQPVWIGDEKVTSSVGFTMLPGTSMSIDIDNLTELFATSNVSAQVVEWIGV